jgi:hypothetical protein
MMKETENVKKKMGDIIYLDARVRVWLLTEHLRKELHSFNAGHNDLFERGGEEVIENFLSRL